MVIVAAAAITAATFGAYKGGKAAVVGAKTKLQEIKEDRIVNKMNREEKEKQKAEEEARKAFEASLTVDERLARYKRERNNEMSRSKQGGGVVAGLGSRFRKSKQ